MSATSALRSGIPAGRAADIAAFMLAPLLFAVLAFRHRWMSDDGYIVLRVAENLVSGHGPVFNPGERVEAVTSPLWLLIVAFVTFVGGLDYQAMPALAVWLGLGFAVAALILAQYGALLLLELAARRDGLTPDAASADRLLDGSRLLPLGALAVAAMPPFWDFATSGLETALGWFWLAAAFVLLIAAFPSQVPHTAWRMPAPLIAVWLGLGPLVRPDFAIFSLFFLLALLLFQLPDWRRLMLCAVAALVLPLGYQVFRMGYYASVVPNTAIAKEAALSNWPQGFAYMLDYFQYTWAFLPLLLGLPFLMVLRARPWRSWDQRFEWVLAAAPFWAGILHAVLMIRVGGDFMHARFLLPGTFAVLLPVAMVRLQHRWHGLALIVFLQWVVLSGTMLRTPYQDRVDFEEPALGGGIGVANERAHYVGQANHPNPVGLADFNLPPRSVQLRRFAPDTVFVFIGTVPQLKPFPADPASPERRVLKIQNIGRVSFAVGPSMYIADSNGLADPVFSRFAIDPRHRGRPGHEKHWSSKDYATPWVLGRFAALDRIDPDTFERIDEARAAVEALQCGPLPGLLNAVRDPLDLPRFFHNVGLAPRLSRLRIPDDPFVARQVLCEAAAS